jgi:hypothetical protein
VLLGSGPPNPPVTDNIPDSLDRVFEPYQGLQSGDSTVFGGARPTEPMEFNTFLPSYQDPTFPLSEPFNPQSAEPNSFVFDPTQDPPLAVNSIEDVDKALSAAIDMLGDAATAWE